MVKTQGEYHSHPVYYTFTTQQAERLWNWLRVC